MNTTTSSNVMSKHPIDYSIFGKAWITLEHAQLAQYRMHMYRAMKQAATMPELKSYAKEQEKQYAKMYWELWNKYKEIINE